MTEAVMLRRALQDGPIGSAPEVHIASLLRQFASQLTCNVDDCTLRSRPLYPVVLLWTATRAWT